MAPRMSEEHLQQRRADIMHAAIDVFIEQGYAHTTMKHVMDATGLSRGGLYRYFSNKEDLFEAIIEKQLSDAAANTEQLLRATESHWELLMQLMFGKSGNPDAEMDPLAPSKLEFFITGRNDGRRKAYAKKRYDLGVRIYRDVIKAGQDAGEFSNRYESDLLARSIITFIDGLALEDSILPDDDVQLEKQSGLFVDYLKMALDV
ncbi:TetR/AcrR family transcriptional regulator [Virgibacillus ihumii]|uniref:TetR/AcrR family transcriptional regulator n=1 Tax=Virgibacillus ihumii TaxID=2686091 RepID=UPI00157C7AED|nr:TetR/AcrR family transcriptional regulator [Virgibacillus ihumii]